MRRHFMLVLLLGSIESGLFGQTAAPEWGTTAESVLSISAFDCDVSDSAQTFAMSGGGSRYITSGTFRGCHAPFSLPTGVVVTGLEVQGCDQSNTGFLHARIMRQSITGAGTELTQHLGGTEVETDGPGTPGCGNYSVQLDPFTFDGASGIYLVQWWQGGSVSDGSIRFSGVRVRYKLQVSPSPATATFNDVPVSHPFFRFVEALSAAGITGGCDVNLYCPDAPITRGQMAVFLAVALGLHFPN